MVRGAEPSSRFGLSRPAVAGRSPEADFFLDDTKASRRHVRFVPSATRVVIEELGSANGTFVNGKKLTGKAALFHGDKVLIGDTLLQIDAPALTRDAGSGKRSATTAKRAGATPAPGAKPADEDDTQRIEAIDADAEVRVKPRPDDGESRTATAAKSRPQAGRAAAGGDDVGVRNVEKPILRAATPRGLLDGRVGPLNADFSEMSTGVKAGVILGLIVAAVLMFAIAAWLTGGCDAYNRPDVPSPQAPVDAGD
jgi:pSer/pThr/pTyr-binding forkhead associated (FHA) protein